MNDNNNDDMVGLMITTLGTLDGYSLRGTLQRAAECGRDVRLPPFPLVPVRSLSFSRRKDTLNKNTKNPQNYLTR